jgi:Ice-binding-like
VKRSKRQTGIRPRKWLGAATAVFVAGLLALLSALLSGPAVGSPAAGPTTVLLGNAGRFALLAGSGLTNTGVTTVSGDVGAGNPTPTETGFQACAVNPADCVVLTGASSNHVGDGVAFDGQAALTAAYNDAAGRTATRVATQLGTQNLDPGVYDSASGTFQITGALTLNAHGDPDAVWIFQMGTTLNTAVGSTVNLVNGAQSCNIFWQVGSSASLGSASLLRGTVMAHDSISVDDAATVRGRLLAGARANHAGAVTLIHDTITRPSCAPVVPPSSSSPPPTTSGPPPTTTGPPPTTTGPPPTTGGPPTTTGVPTTDQSTAPTGPGPTGGPSTDQSSAPTSPGGPGTGTITPSPTGPQVTQTPSGPVGTGDSLPPAPGGGAGGAHYGLVALLLLVGTGCVVGVARLAQRWNH